MGAVGVQAVQVPMPSTPAPFDPWGERAVHQTVPHAHNTQCNLFVLNWSMYLDTFVCVCMVEGDGGVVNVCGMCVGVGWGGGKCVCVCASESECIFFMVIK